MNETVVANNQNADADTRPPLYVPPLELTKGQPTPVAANGALSFASLDRNGDAGTGAAIEAALRHIADGRGQEVTRMLETALPGPIQTQWGVGFREYDECVAYIQEQGLAVPDGGVVLPLRYTINESPSWSVVPSNALWKDPARAADAQKVGKEEIDNRKRSLYFPHLLRDARRIGDYRPGLRPDSPECMDRLGVSLAHLESTCQDFYDAHEVERVFYPEIEKLLLEFFPGTTDALVYNHDVFDQQYQGDRTENQDDKNPGINENYVNLVHNDLNDNSGRVRARELLLNNLRNFGREQRYTEAQVEEKLSRRFVSINLAKPFETVQQWPFVLCAWPSFADQRYINNYRIYDDRVGETTRFTNRVNHEWYWFPRQQPNEISMLKCYDSVTDASVSRWSFHSACFDWTAPPGVPLRRNVVVRAYVFY